MKVNKRMLCHGLKTYYKHTCHNPQEVSGNKNRLFQHRLSESEESERDTRRQHQCVAYAWGSKCQALTLPNPLPTWSDPTIVSWRVQFVQTSNGIVEEAHLSSA